ncbi:MAG: tRNA (adenosine(37)-N6)-threonylcarbamoyltransferase complex ATPase subunit type 1 TsaE [Acidimicrobiales bacterium]
MSWTVRVRTASPTHTRALAASLASVARRGDVVVLAGMLGAGKTTFAQGFARGLGVQGPVTSPTFTLVRQYPCSLGQLFHADVYRLDHLVEVADLGLGELVEDGVALVEWGDVAVPALGPVIWTVSIAPLAGEDEDVREVTVHAEDDDRYDAVGSALRSA